MCNGGNYMKKIVFIHQLLSVIHPLYADVQKHEVGRHSGIMSKQIFALFSKVKSVNCNSCLYLRDAIYLVHTIVNRLNLKATLSDRQYYQSKLICTSYNCKLTERGLIA